MKGFIKKSGIYFDTKVKKGSNNAVTSDAVAKAIEEGGGGGGGGGSTDYADLTNKPKINNVELSGNKTLDDLGIASETDLNTLSENVGDLSELTTTDKTSLVNAINEAVASGGGGGSSGGVKYQRFTNKATTGSVTISSIAYVAFTENNVKTWFSTSPNTIHTVIASKSNGTVVRVAVKNGVNQFIMEQSNTAVTYEYVGVFYE